jgi:hypothetical protein
MCLKETSDGMDWIDMSQVKVKLKVFRYKPDVDLGVPGG